MFLTPLGELYKRVGRRWWWRRRRWRWKCVCVCVLQRSYLRFTELVCKESSFFFVPFHFPYTRNEVIHATCWVSSILSNRLLIRINLSYWYFIHDQRFMLSLFQWLLSFFFFRGMLTLGTSEAVKSEVVSTPELDLSGRSTTNNKTIILSQSESPNPRTLWPSFHNGVAAGLKISLGASDIDATWILLNKLK